MFFIYAILKLQKGTEVFSSAECPKNVETFNSPQSKGFYIVIKFSFDSNRKHSDQDLDTKFTRIGHV